MAIIFKAIMAAAQSVNPPKAMVDYYYSEDVAYYEYYAEYYGITYEEILASAGLDDASLRARAEDNVMKDIAVYSIAKAEGLVVTNSNYAEHIAAYVEYTGYSEKELLEMYTKDELREQMSYKRVYDVIESWQNIIVE